MDFGKRNEIVLRIGDAEPRSQVDLEQKVFRFIRKILQATKEYALQFSISKTCEDVFYLAAKEGIAFSAILDVLKTNSTSTGGYPVMDCFPNTETYILKDSDCSWQVGYWLDKEKGAYSYDIVFDIHDRKKLEGYLDSRQGIEYAVYPRITKRYGKIEFDFLNGVIRKDGKVTGNFTADTQEAKLAALLLDNRDRLYSYAQLLEYLGETKLLTRNAADAKKRVMNIFSSLNKKCGGKPAVFKCNNGYFLPKD